MNHEEASQGERRRYASSSSDGGIIHLIVDADFRRRQPVYISACGKPVPAADADVVRAKHPPGLLCRECDAAAAATQ